MSAFTLQEGAQVPPLYRREAELFVQLFDGGALTYEVLATACHLPLEPIP